MIRLRRAGFAHNPNWVYTFRENVYRLNPEAGQKLGIWTNMGAGHASPADEDLAKLFAWLLSGEEMEGAKFLTSDDQAWNRDYYHTMDTLPAGY